jgi:hypothetical protein
MCPRACCSVPSSPCRHFRATATPAASTRIPPASNPAAIQGRDGSEAAMVMRTATGCDPSAFMAATDQLPPRPARSGSGPRPSRAVGPDAGLGGHGRGSAASVPGVSRTDSAAPEGPRRRDQRVQPSGVSESPNPRRSDRSRHFWSGTGRRRARPDRAVFATEPRRRLPAEYASTDERVEASIVCARFRRLGAPEDLERERVPARPPGAAYAVLPADSGRASWLGSRSRFGGLERSWSCASLPVLPAVSSRG